MGKKIDFRRLLYVSQDDAEAKLSHRKFQRGREGQGDERLGGGQGGHLREHFQTTTTAEK